LDKNTYQSDQYHIRDKESEIFFLIEKLWQQVKKRDINQQHPRRKTANLNHNIPQIIVIRNTPNQSKKQDKRNPVESVLYPKFGFEMFKNGLIHIFKVAQI